MVHTWTKVFVNVEISSLPSDLETSFTKGKSGVEINKWRGSKHTSYKVNIGNFREAQEAHLGCVMQKGP